MKLTDINIRDPFILPYKNKYYLYGSRVAILNCSSVSSHQVGFDVYISEDLEEWSTPKEIFSKTSDFWATKQFWAPEVHSYNGKFYMFASFKSENRHRGTQILVSDTPDGRFKPLSDFPITPEDWECLDGTLYFEDGIPYMVFCHEWTQVGDGEVCGVRLTKDLKNAEGKPFLMWKATDAEWVKGINGGKGYVTDGPYLFKTNNGKLISLWSSFNKDGNYTVGSACSDTGKIGGRWVVGDKLLFDGDGGHAMLFKTFDSKLKMVLHSPNKSKPERPIIVDFDLNLFD